jgi:hypothetical protein
MSIFEFDHKKGISSLAIILIIAGILVLGGAIYIFRGTLLPSIPPQQPEPQQSEFQSFVEQINDAEAMAHEQINVAIENFNKLLTNSEKQELLLEERDALRIRDLLLLDGEVRDHPQYYTPDASLNDVCSKYYWATIPNAKNYFNESLIQATQTFGGIDGVWWWLPLDPELYSTGGSRKTFKYIDPVNDKDHFYSFSCSSTPQYEQYTGGSARKFKIIANMESSCYQKGGEYDAESTDGGNNPDIYEVGSDIPPLNTAKHCRLSVQKELAIKKAMNDYETKAIYDTISRYSAALKNRDVATIAFLTGESEQTLGDFYTNPENAPMLDSLADAFKTAKIKEEYADDVGEISYIELEAIDPQVGPFDIIMLKQTTGVWIISGY